MLFRSISRTISFVVLFIFLFFSHFLFLLFLSEILVLYALNCLLCLEFFHFSLTPSLLLCFTAFLTFNYFLCHISLDHYLSHHFLKIFVTSFNRSKSIFILLIMKIFFHYILQDFNRFREQY